MGKVLEFFSKFSFSLYLLREHLVTKDIIANAYANVAVEKKKLEELGKQLPAAVGEVSSHIAADTYEIDQRPVIRNRAEFYDDTGMSSAKLREKQIGVLKKVTSYNCMIDRESNEINQLNEIREGWEARLATKVIVQPKKVPPEVVEKICERLYGVEPAVLSDALKKGGAIDNIFTYNEAEIVVNHLNSYKISAKAVECNAEEQVNSMSKNRNSESYIRRIARNQRIFLSILWFIFWGVMATIYLTVWSYGDYGFGIALAVVAAVGSALILLVLWLLTKPIIAVAWRVINRSFSSNAQKIIDRTGYLRGVVLSEEYEKGLDVLYTGLIKCLNAYNANCETVDSYARVFLPERAYSEILPMVIEQMSIGATFNDALYKTEATIDRKIAMQRAEERAARLEKETLRHNAELEVQARRSADAAEQRARAAELAVQEQRNYNEAIRAHTRAVEENTREIRRDRYGL